MISLYKLLFRLMQWQAIQVDRVLFWLYLRLIDEFEVIEMETSEQLEPPPENSVHIPRRGLH